jgi:hypothetical protein
LKVSGLHSPWLAGSRRRQRWGCAENDLDRAKAVLESLGSASITVTAARTSNVGSVLTRLAERHPDGELRRAAAEARSRVAAQLAERIATINARTRLRQAEAVLPAPDNDPSLPAMERLAKHLERPLPPLPGIYEACSFAYDTTVAFNNQRRTREKAGSADATGPVIYWMNRGEVGDHDAAGATDALVCCRSTHPR